MAFFKNLFNSVKNIFSKEVVEEKVEQEIVPEIVKKEDVQEIVEEDIDTKAVVEESEDRIAVRNQINSYLERSDKRKINQIAVHCTATRPNVNVTIEKIDAWHKARGFKKQPISGHYCGYHFVVAEDGTIMFGRNIQEIGAHVAGYNTFSIGVCYVGGLDEKGKSVDTRTDEQKESLIWLISLLKHELSISVVKGHRDYSPDKNGDGKITKDEWIKACPCFEAIDEYKDL